MKKQLTLSIPEPCHENWDKMLPSEKGKFCLSCQKDVIDFTGMTDKELFNFFATQQTEKICGMVLPAQLDKAILQPVEPKKKRLWYVQYLTAFFLFINKTDSKAQVKPPTCVSPATNTLRMGKVKFVPPSLPGRVVNEDGQPIAFASIRIKHSGTTIKTDSVGNFLLDIKVEDADVLEISSVGYERKELPVLQLKQNREIVLPGKSLFLKEVVVNANYGTRMLGSMAGGIWVRHVQNVTILKKITDTISGKNVFKVYPNPVNRGTGININMKGVSRGEYQFMLINSAGAIVQQDPVTVPDKEFIFQLPVKPSVTAGTYFLNITDPGNRLIYKSKLVVL